MIIKFVPSQVKVLEISLERNKRIVQRVLPDSPFVGTYFVKSFESRLFWPPISRRTISGESRIPSSPLSARRLMSRMLISLRRLSGEVRLFAKFDAIETDRSGVIGRLESVGESGTCIELFEFRNSLEDFISGDFSIIERDSNMPNN